MSPSVVSTTSSSSLHHLNVFRMRVINATKEDDLNSLLDELKTKIKDDSIINECKILIKCIIDKQSF